MNKGYKALISLKRFIEARDAFLDGIDVSPNEPALYIGLANLDILENNFVDAISSYRKALRLGYADKEAINKAIAKLEKDLDKPEYL